jgi:hypothetical protein
VSFVEQPRLSTWGIEEIEANTCEDNSYNRRILAGAKIPHRILEPGIIEVLCENYDELNAHHESVYDRKKIILKNPKDPWSDYLPFDELPLDFMETAPAWMQRHLNKYNDAVAEGVPEHKLPIFPERCRRRRADGSRCWNWSWPAKSAEGFCKGHSKFGAFNVMEQHAKLSDAAKMRLSQLSPTAIEALEDLLLNSTVPHVRLKAATEILDRVGIRGGTELTISGQIDHTVTNPADEVRQRLNALAEKISPAELPAARSSSSENADGEPLIVEAEVIEVEDPR